MKFKFAALLLVTFICAPATLKVGQIVEDNFYILGQLLILVGTLGWGAACASLGIFALTHAESFTKGTIIPLLAALPPKLGGIIIGVQFIIVAGIMVYQALNIIGQLYWWR